MTGLLNTVLGTVVWGNTVELYMTAAGILIGAFIGIWAIRKTVLNRMKAAAEKTATSADDYAIRFIRRGAVPLAYIGALYGSFSLLAVPEALSRGVYLAVMTAVVIVAARAVNDLIGYAFRVYQRRTGRGPEMEHSFGGILVVIQAIVWTAAIVFYLDNLGFKVSTVLAGLGIGGVAVALAAQTILQDLFSYVCILFDRPFEIGDFIIVGDFMGVVEHVGVKTTRIRSLGGEQLVFSNKDLTDSRVRNYKRMEQRRVVFSFGVLYQTPQDKMKRIPEIVKEVICALADTRFDRAHFARIGASSLDFEVVYYVLSGDYNKYMDIQQQINFMIRERLADMGVEFAYPTQTLYLNKENW